MSVIPGVLYRATTTALVAPGRPSVPFGIDRTALTLGTYIPGKGTAGLLQGWTPDMLEPVYPPGSTATVKGSSTQIAINGPGPYVNKIFWGTVLMKYKGAKFINCAFPGPGVGQACIKSYGTGYESWSGEDCLVDAGLWMDPTLTRPGGEAAWTYDKWHRTACNTNGIHGGRFNVQRWEIRRVGDSISETMVKRDASDVDETVAEGCWFHQNAYYFAADWATVGVQSDGNHADHDQIANGGKHTRRGNRYGGYRDEQGYTLYPADPAAISDNIGDDAWNSGIIFTQQTSTDDAHRIQGVLIEKNFFEGGKYCINHPLVSASIGVNDFSDTVVRDNFFIRRNDGTGNGALQTDGHYARYVNRALSYAGSYSNNRVIDLDAFGNFTVGELIVYKNA